MARSGTGLVAAGALAAILASGCVKVPEPLAVSAQPVAAQGYVYKGPLLRLHPLEPTVRRLLERAAALRKVAEGPRLTPKEWLWTVQPLGLAAEEMPAPPVAGTWDLEAPPSNVPQPPGRVNIAALRQWREQRVRARYQRLEANAAADEAFKLSELEIGLWQKAQVALNNLKIQEAVGGPGAAQAQEQQQQIAANIARQVAAARRASDERLARTKADLQAQLEQDLAQMREQSAERQAAPPTIPRPTQELKVLESNLNLQWWLPEPLPMEVSPETQQMAQALSAEGEKQVAAEQKQLAETARAQAERLVEAAGRIERLINDDLETAVRSLALTHGVKVNIPPQEPAKGKDLTAEAARWLKEVWMQH